MKSSDRRVEVIESFFHNPRTDFSSQAAHGESLIDDEEPSSLLDTCDNRVHIERHDGAQVDHFARDAILFQGSCCFEALVNEFAARDDRESLSFAYTTAAWPKGK